MVVSENGDEDLAAGVHVLEPHADDFGVDIAPAFNVRPTRLRRGIATRHAHVLLNAVLTVCAVGKGENLDSIVDGGDSFDFVHEDNIQLFEEPWGV